MHMHPSVRKLRRDAVTPVHPSDDGKTVPLEVKN
jgi:hypothetical protein